MTKNASNIQRVQKLIQGLIFVSICICTISSMTMLSFASEKVQSQLDSNIYAQKEFTGKQVKDMADNNTMIELSGDGFLFQIPAEEINIEYALTALARANSYEDITVKLTCEKGKNEIKEDYDQGLDLLSEHLSFAITCSDGVNAFEIDRFFEYVKKEIKIPEGVNPADVTTAAVIREDGSLSHVPTKVVRKEDGSAVAEINSLSDSEYTLISHDKKFEDVKEDYWAKDEIEDLASRMIINGDTPDTFLPNNTITRGELVATLVRAMGIQEKGLGRDIFGDVTKNMWYYDSIAAAYDYGLIQGTGEQALFHPERKMTRSEAVTMMARAQTYFKDVNFLVKKVDIDSTLSKFSDGNEVETWAMDAVASCVTNDILKGYVDHRLQPKAEITRAESSAILQRLLTTANLI